MYLELASWNSRGTTGYLPRRMQEIGVHCDDRPGRLCSVGFDEFQVPGLGHPGVQYPEAVFASRDAEFRQDLAVDHPFVSGGRPASHYLEQLVAPVGGAAEPLVGEYQRDVGQAVVARQPQRARRVELVPRILLIIDDIHAVETQVVVVRCESGPVVVIPESMHGFARIADSPEGVNAGVSVGVMVVLEEPGPEEIAGETVALRPRMPGVQMYRGLVPAKAGGNRRHVVLETDERRQTIGVEHRLGRISAVEPPDVRRQQVC